MYDCGEKIDTIDNADEYLVQELVYASDAHYYGKQFFYDMEDMKFAWGQSKFLYEIECAIVEALMIEE